MSTYKKITPVKTWQFFTACKHYLGIAALTSLFKVGHRQIDRWASDTDSSQRNPLDKIESLLKKLMALGADDIAWATVDRMAKIVGCTMRVKVNVRPDKRSLAEELLDNLPALAEYQEVARPGSRAPVQVVRAKAMSLIREIEEDLALIESGRTE
jgi:hypothetical protein